MSKRRKAREAALQILYGIDLTDTRPGAAVAAFERYLSEHDPEPFTKTLVLGVCENKGELDEVIRGASHRWRLERMPRVDRNILRLGTFELKHLEDVPRRVTINEMIELAKRFGGEQSSGFVNGVLDKIAQELQKG